MSFVKVDDLTYEEQLALIRAGVVTTVIGSIEQYVTCTKCGHNFLSTLNQTAQTCTSCGRTDG